MNRFLVGLFVVVMVAAGAVLIVRVCDIIKELNCQ